MSDPVIRVENLTKRYLISHQNSSRDGLRHTLEEALRHPLKWLQERNGPKCHGREEFLALNEVSFGVNRGEVVGIIGRNGAGKSTLLKILSRITEPTSGRITIDGRIASLLEVGTGFHPELTGRENIFLNGAILGMTRAEIKSKFDEIVAFSEVEKFLDTPVKRYSSGMYVRLAFSVAAHLEPEILIIDEVLAVGDAPFQQKCIGKMGEVAKGGRTVLFVSHNIGAVTQLCTECIYLADGAVAMQGAVDRVVAEYSRRTSDSKRLLRHHQTTLSIQFMTPASEPLDVWEYGSEAIAEVRVCSEEPLIKPAVDLAFYDENGVRVFALMSDTGQQWIDQSGKKTFSVRFRFRNPGFASQALNVDVGLRVDGRGGYLCCWQRIETIPLTLRNIKCRVPQSTIMAMPCKIEEIEYEK
jgi:lipopolysaccharide transport system ATP-binding protein